MAHRRRGMVRAGAGQLRWRGSSGSLGLLLALLVCAVGAGLEATAWAQDEAAARDGAAADGAVEGVIVAVREGEVIVDLGLAHGLHEAAQVEVLRRVEVTHPRTGERLEDRFPIGTLELERVGTLLSITTRTDGLERAPAEGDFVVFRAGEAPAPEAAAEAPVGEATAAPQAEVVTLERTFRRGLGKPLEERIVLYEQFLVAFPQSEHADAVVDELRWLYGIRDARAAVAAPRQTAGELAPATLTTFFAAPTRLRQGEPATVDVSVLEREEVALVRLLVGRVHATGYETLEMAPHGDFNFSATLPAAWTEQSGRIALFAEVVRVDGTVQPVGGDLAAPHWLRVDEVVPDVPERAQRSTARALFEYVDFWLEGEGADAYLRFEADFRYLVDWWIVRGFRMGVGIFQGEGGGVDALEAGEASVERNVNYGYAELELEFHTWFGTSLRLSAGNHHDNADGRAEAVLGIGGQLRIGRDTGTRLLLGGAFTESVGNQGWIELVLHELEDWPMELGVLVTNLPVDADLGVSLYYGAGYQITDLVAVSARVGWNARTINHFGLTGGVGTVLSW